ncbi:unnamed protein product [Didymodactylos carnosus]|uniref:Uncharacterized protein n=1 Tax=Didymodactylos carnosus TaxID=1234261 RepID=A0A814NKW2_9BILA|nr:unnamed protein product [Didymodactylos carnosus]CAF3858277.1 unnamed protein product [Didymodactylos carnosus]
MSTLFINTSHLPADMLTFNDNKFYDFVKNICGETEAELLEVQQIVNAQSLLLTDDVFGIMDVDCPDLIDLKKKISFTLADGSFLLKAGIRENIKYLKELFLKKNEVMKETKLKSKQQTTITTAVSNSTPPPSSSIITIAPVSTNSWCLDNKENAGLDDFQLRGGEDFTLKLHDNHNILEAAITCKCGSNFSLTKKDNKFQLSNFYKHIKKLNCSLMKEFVKKNNKQKRTNVQISSSSTSPVQSQPLVQIITNPIVAPSPSTSSISTTAPTKNNSKRSAPASSIPARSSKRKKL